jgi:GTP-binding protein HflX
MLFATLETSVRNIETGDNKPFFLVDTVGFIHKLPHGLVKAFHSTLEEVKYADLLLQIIDFSDPQYRQHMEVTKETLSQLGAGDIPMIYVYNKTDRTEVNFPKVMDDHVYISAKEGIGLDELLELIKTRLKS